MLIFFRSNVCVPENGKDNSMTSTSSCTCIILPNYFTAGVTYHLALQANGTLLWNDTVMLAQIGEIQFVTDLSLIYPIPHPQLTTSPTSSYPLRETYLQSVCSSCANGIQELGMRCHGPFLRRGPRTLAIILGPKHTS